MNAAEFYEKVWIKEHGDDPRGDWMIRMAEAFAASETARADRAEANYKITGEVVDNLEAKLEVAEAEIHLKDNYFTNAALEVVNANERVRTLEAEIQRKDAALRASIERSTHYPLANRLQDMRELATAALVPLPSPTPDIL